MRIRSAGATDPGHERSHNEDCFLIDASLGVYIVCDGMGGHEAGEVASHTAAQAARDAIATRAAWLEQWSDTPQTRQELVLMVAEAVQEASSAVYRQARQGDGRAGMGTTLSMVVVVGSLAVVGHVGDSRIYLMRQRTLHQLSEDHTFLAEFVRNGLPLEKARESRMGHRLTRAVGLQPNVQVDTLTVELVSGDRMLVCSDGLMGHLETPEAIGPLLLAGSVSSRPEALVRFGLEHDGSDNVTALVIAVLPDHEPSLHAQAREQHVMLKLEALRHIWLFEHLTLREQSLVLERTRERDVPAGTVLITEGDRSDNLFIVVEGGFEVYRGESLVNTLEAGAHFGEMALVSQRPRRATVKATEPAHVLEMYRDDFATLVNTETALGVKLLWTMTEVLIDRM